MGASPTSDGSPRMIALRKTLSILAATAAASVLLAGCAGEDPEAAPSLGTMTTAASPTAGMPGSDPATWAPIMLRKGTKTLELVTRQVAVWPALEYANNPDFTVVTSDPTVVEALPSGDGTVVGIIGVGPGEAVVRVYKTPDVTGKAFRKVTVTVSQ